MLAVPRQSSKPRVSFDPKGFRDARKKYEKGDPRNLIAMMKEAETDSHVAGCLIGRRSGYKRGYSIVSYEDESTDNERREWIQGVLERLHLRDLLEEIHAARMYTYSVVDFEWELMDGRDTPVAFEAFDQKYFRRDDNRILRVDWGQRLEEIPETALVTEMRPSKLPIMMPVLREFILKEYGVAAWSSFMENWGEAFIWGKYPPASDDAFKKQLEDAVNAIAASSRGIGPDGSSVEVIESAKTAGDHDKYVARADKGIAISLLGHANSVEQSSGLQVGDNTSSYEVRFDLAVDDMHWLEPHVNRLIRTIWRRNFTDQRYPRFELDKKKPVDVKEHADIVDMAFRHGLPIDPDEYRKLGLYVDPGQQALVRQTRATDILLD